MSDEAETTQESVEGQSQESGAIEGFVETDAPEKEPGLDELFAGGGPEGADEVAADEGDVDEEQWIGSEEGPEAEASAEEDEGDEAADERAIYRDPDTGMFITASEAEARGLEPESLSSLEDEADTFFEGDEEDGEPEGEKLRFDVPTASEDEEAEPVTYELEGLSPEAREYLESQLSRAERVDELESERTELEETRRDVDERLRTLREIEDRLEVDPVGFMVSEIPEDRRGDVAIDLLLESDEVYDRVVEKLNEYERNPTLKERDKYKRKAERTEETTKVRSKREAHEARVERAREIGSRIRSWIPDEMSRSMKRQFMEDAVADVRRYVSENPMEPQEFDLDALPQILEHRLELYGIEVDTRPERRTNGARPSEPADERTEDMAARAERARQVGERLRKARARKVDAASTAPAGAGSVPDSGRPGPGATLEDALDYSRQAGV